MSQVGQINLTKKKPPRAGNGDQRIWNDVYDQLNTLVDAVNQGSTTEHRRGAGGKTGDIRVFKDKSEHAAGSPVENKYFMEVKVEDGWAIRELAVTDKGSRTGTGYYSVSNAVEGSGTGGKSGFDNLEYKFIPAINSASGKLDLTIGTHDGTAISNSSIVEGDLVGDSKVWDAAQKPNKTTLASGYLYNDGSSTGTVVSNADIVEGDLVGSGKTFGAGQKPNKTLISGNNLTLDGSDQGAVKNAGVTVSTDGTLNGAGGGKVDGKTAWPSGTRPADNSDVTLTAVNNELSVTGGGIVFTSGSPKIRAGQSGYDTGTGFWLGIVGGTAKFSIGNASGNKMTWNGSSLDITGSVTVTGGNAETTTGSQSKADTAESNAEGTAATDATNKAAAAEAAAKAASLLRASYLTSNTTTINGGTITTGSIAADRITANSITADQINTSNITTAVVTSESVNATNISATSISTGTLSAAEINMSNGLAQITTGGDVTTKRNVRVWSSDVGDGSRYGLQLIKHGAASITATNWWMLFNDSGAENLTFNHGGTNVCELTTGGLMVADQGIGFNSSSYYMMYDDGHILVYLDGFTDGGSIYPYDASNSVSDGYDLGKSNKKWRKLFVTQSNVGDLVMANNDGTANWTLREKPDCILARNSITQKTFKLNMTETSEYDSEVWDEA